jgi:hypothetical protein
MKDVTEKIQGLIQAAGELKPGTVTHIDVKHLDGCPAIRTQRLVDCTCNPDFKVMRPDA